MATEIGDGMSGIHPYLTFCTTGMARLSAVGTVMYLMAINWMRENKHLKKER
jgi:hypothetical protein